jgi:16S rRNA (adenine1518-N6/adenine1519-N6)-dimethyltransferase
VEALGIRPTKTLGQNFVHDPGGVLPGDEVLEIGPGLGSLTLALLEAGARVIHAHLGATIPGYRPGCV